MNVAIDDSLTLNGGVKMALSGQETGLNCVQCKGRNRHNVECFFERVLYFGWPNQPSSGTMEHFASGRVFM